MSRNAKNRCSISSRTPLSERITPAISAPIASESSSSIAIALIAITKPNTASRKNSSSSRPSCRPIQAPSQREAASDAATNTNAFVVTPAVSADAAAARRDESEHRGDRDVLEEEDREHEVGLVVREAPEVDQAP